MSAAIVAVVMMVEKVALMSLGTQIGKPRNPHYCLLKVVCNDL